MKKRNVKIINEKIESNGAIRTAIYAWFEAQGLELTEQRHKELKGLLGQFVESCQLKAERAASQKKQEAKKES